MNYNIYWCLTASNPTSLEESARWQSLLTPPFGGTAQASNFQALKQQQQPQNIQTKTNSSNNYLTRRGKSLLGSKHFMNPIDKQKICSKRANRKNHKPWKTNKTRTRTTKHHQWQQHNNTKPTPNQKQQNNKQEIKKKDRNRKISANLLSCCSPQSRLFCVKKAHFSNFDKNNAHRKDQKLNSPTKPTRNQITSQT